MTYDTEWSLKSGKRYHLPKISHDFEAYSSFGSDWLKSWGVLALFGCNGISQPKLAEPVGYLCNVMRNSNI